MRVRLKAGNAVRCSFCHRADTEAGQMVAAPTDYARAYICDECIAICKAIIEDDRVEGEQATGSEAAAEDHRMLHHRLTAEFFTAVERWITRDASSLGTSEDIAAVRGLAEQILRGQ